MNNQTAALEAKVKEVIAEQLSLRLEEIKNEANLIDDLGADSLDIVELVIAMEDEFETEIPDEDAEKIQTVQDIIDYVTQHIQ